MERVTIRPASRRAFTLIAEGRLGDPGRGRQTFQAYVEQVWLPGHQVEATTRQSSRSAGPWSR